MTDEEIDNLLDLLDAFADERGGGGELACFHAVRAIRSLRPKLDDERDEARCEADQGGLF